MKNKFNDQELTHSVYEPDRALFETFQNKEEEISQQNLKEYRDQQLQKKLQMSKTIQNSVLFMSSNFQSQLKDHQKQQEQLIQKTKQTQEKEQFQRLSQLQSSLVGKNGSKGKELDVLMQINKLKSEIEQIQQDHSKIQEESQVFQQKIELMRKSAVTDNQEPKQQVNTEDFKSLIENIKEIKEMLKPISQIHMNASEIQKQEPTQPVKDNQEERKWKVIILEERVKLNRQKENLKSIKANIKITERKLLTDQDDLKQQIRLAKSSQNVKTKQLLKKMKADIQQNLLRLSESIIQVNDDRMVNKLKQNALNELEQAFNAKDFSQQISQIESLFKVYQSFDEKIKNKSTFRDTFDRYCNENQKQSADSMFQGYQFDDSANYDIRDQNLQTFDPKPIMKKSSKNPNYYADVQQRLDLVGHKDWLQNYKYKLIQGSNTFENHDKLIRYQDFLQMR